MEMVAPAREVLRFECFMLDLRRRELMTAAGRCVPIEGKRFDLLAFLVSRRDEAVSRDEIVGHVWGGRVVSEGLVTVHVHELRKALKQAGCERQVIITLPNQRYRFVGEAPAPEPEALPFVVPAVPDLAPAVRGRHWLLVVAAPVLALVVVLALVGVLRRGFWGGGVSAPRLSIVVLPFRNLGNDRGQDYLADAITTDLTSDLAHIPESTVIARESAEAVQSASPQEIGRRLHVRYLLRGSILPEEANFHITAYLVDTSTGAQLWTAQFDRPREGMSAAREDIVHHIASALHFQLDQLENTRSRHDRPDNPDALDLFFRARAVADSADTISDISAAQDLLERAVSKQPDFADAKAELGWLLLHKVAAMDDRDEYRDYARAKEVIAGALSLSPQNAKALAARAKERQQDERCSEAKPYAMQALSVEPSSLEARAVLAHCAQIDSRFDEAADQYENMLRLNPNGLDNRLRLLELGHIRVIQGRLTEATDLLNQSLAGEDPVSDPNEGIEPAELSHILLIAARDLAGDAVQARTMQQVYARQWPGRSTWRLSTYFPKGWLHLGGVQRELRALEDAGMPRFVNEHVSVVADPDNCVHGDFAPTPGFLPGGKIVDTQAVIRLKEHPAPPAIIDVGRGAAVMPGAAWRDPATTTEAADDFALRSAVGQTEMNLQATVVVLGDGSTGCGGYAAAEKLVAGGFRHVAWYKGGEEAWAASAQAFVDRRGQ